MSAGFQAVQWGRAKYIYDAILLGCVTAYVGGFALIAWRVTPPKNLADQIDIFIRAFGSCAFLMLTAILCIGPLARLDQRCLKALYNRRHFGVLTFLVAATHAWLMIEWYLAQGNLGNELITWAVYAKFIGFPFKTLGMAALLVLFLMAATSHDFWLAFLGPKVWKALHMALYVAYGLVVMHVALGIMQYERTPLVPIMLIGGFGAVVTLHLIAAFREHKADRGKPARDGWLAVGPPLSIPDKCARIVVADGGERIAVFRDGTQVGALTNLCAHQNGPLGEGRIIDGCVTCPWHGLADGRAPEPFTEKVATHRVRLVDGIIEVDVNPLPPGTPAAIQVPL